MAKTRIERRLAERVRALRVRQGLSQADLARLVHTSRSQVAAVETGEKTASIATVETFAHALGVSIGNLVDETTNAAYTPDRADRLAITLRERGSAYLTAVERIIGIGDRLADAENRPPSRTSKRRAPT